MHEANIRQLLCKTPIEDISCNERLIMPTALNKNYWEWETFIVTILILFIIIFVRYILFSGLYHYTFFNLLKSRYKNKRLHPGNWKRKQLNYEILFSGLSAFIFALIGILSFTLWQKGWTKIYFEWDTYSYIYLPLSVFLVLFLQDTYYYWIHRWMHKPKILPIFHWVHHKSMHTSVLTSFSFHPLETFLQAIVFPIFIIVIPLHVYMALFCLLVMTVSATINHASVEIFPKRWSQLWLTKWLIGATHHDLHHKEFKYNYGLYFTFWDHIMKTESPNYHKKTNND